jgi:hypothetical protein
MPFKLQDGEKILWEGKPESRIYVLWFFTKVIGTTFILSAVIGYLTMMSCVFFAAIRHAKQPVFYPILSVLVIIVPVTFVLTLLYYRHLKETFR